MNTYHLYRLTSKNASPKFTLNKYQMHTIRTFELHHFITILITSNKLFVEK
jgi:hypothetical protein